MRRNSESPQAATACFLAAAALAFSAINQAFAEPAIVPAANCETLVGVNFSGSTIVIEKAEALPEAPAGTVQVRPPDPATVGVAIPSHCRAQGVIDRRVGGDGKNYAIGFSISLPDRWNGRFLFQGGGGLNGAIRPPLGPQAAGDVPALARGFAVVSTDSGHQGAVFDGSFMADQEAALNFAQASIGKVTAAAKAIIARYYGQPAAHSYFVGCSTGGREALMSAQRYPLSFDGIVAGAPAWPMMALLARGAQDQRALSKPGAWIPPAKLAALTKAALAACGKGKTYIADPTACKFDPRVIECRGKDTNECLTPPQVTAARFIYSTSKEPDGRVLWGQLPGAEGVKGAWDNWIIGQAPGAKGKAAGEEFARNFYAYMVTGDSNIAPEKVSDADIAKGRAMFAAMIEASNADLSNFKARGGKLIQYHGWNDPAIPSRFSTEYFDAVQKQMGDTRDFYRLFMIPGMLHCGGGDAPTTVDWLPLLEDWVERGKAPDAVIAKSMTGPDTQTILPRKETMR